MDTSRRTLMRYAIALTSIALATWVRLLLQPVFQDRVPFITYFAAIALTAYYAGFGPTVLAIVLAGALADYYFVPPYYRPWPQNAEGWAALGLFGFVGLIIAFSSEMMHRARRRAQESSDEARREQEYFHTTLASIGEGVIVTDSIGRVTFLNSVAAELTGCDLAAAKGLPVETVVRVVNEATREVVENPAVGALKRGRFTQLKEHTVLIARDGRERSVQQSAAPLHDTHGNITGVVLVCRDVSHSRKWDIERGRLAALLLSSEDSIIGLTPRGSIVTWNLGAEKLYGFRAEEVLGQRLASLLVPPQRMEEFNDILARVARGERAAPFETIRNTKDGRLIDVSKRMSPILGPGGEIAGVSTVDRDIGQRRAAERLRNARTAVTQILAQQYDLATAAPRVIKAICRALLWDAGGLWTPDESGTLLRCREIWQEKPSPAFEAFRTQSLELPLAPGAGLVGRVWQTGTCAWIPDVTLDANFPRAATAAEAGLHGAIGAPIVIGGDFLGVVEFFHRHIQQPDEDLLETMATIGHQIGQFIERRRAEDALQESEQRIRSVVQTAMDAIITIDERGVMQTFNPAAERLFGRSAADVIGRNVRVLMPEPYHGEHDSYLSHYLRTGEARVIGSGREVRGLRSDGSTVPIELAVSEFYLKGKRYFTGTLHDITERKRTESILRFLAEASKLLSELVDYRETLERVASLAVPDFADWCAVDMLSPDGTLDRLAVAHADPDKLARIEEFYRQHPHRVDARYGPAYVVRTGRSEWAAEVTDEKLADVVEDEESLAFFHSVNPRSYLCVPLRSQNQTLGTLSFVLTDSGRRYGAEDLAVAEDLARRAVIALENARLYQQVREADRRKDEFLAMLAHELRNPLAPIRSGLDILSLQATAPKETLEVMQRQVDHLVRLVDDLLDVSRIMRGRVELRKGAVQLSDIVAQAADAVRPLATADGKTFSIDVPDDPIWLDVDRVRIAQVLDNLLHNAVKYTDQGALIELRVERQAAAAVIYVRDNGIGIDPELLPKVFDLFTQSTRTLDRAQGGLGIGLTLVRNLVQMHGGTVEAHSEGAGKGSEFVVRLPLTSVEIPPEAPPVPQETGPRRVLVVDDNLGAARLMAALIGKLGPHQVEVAHDGPEALAKLPEFLPDVVLLDIGLPGMDGFEVARAIRQLEAGRQVLLIAVTGYGQEEDRRKSQEAGFDDHLIKPVSLEHVVQLLAHAKIGV